MPRPIKSPKSGSAWDRKIIHEKDIKFDFEKYQYGDKPRRGARVSATKSSSARANRDYLGTVMNPNTILATHKEIASEPAGFRKLRKPLPVKVGSVDAVRMVAVRGSRRDRRRKERRNT